MHNFYSYFCTMLDGLIYIDFLDELAYVVTNRKIIEILDIGHEKTSQHRPSNFHLGTCGITAPCMKEVREKLSTELGIWII